MPPQATLVFDVLLVDVFNPKDELTVQVKDVPEGCTRRTEVGDFVRYHYNGTFQDGTAFDSRSPRGHVVPPQRGSKITPLVLSHQLPAQQHLQHLRGPGLRDPGDGPGPAGSVHGGEEAGHHTAPHGLRGNGSR